MCTTLLNRPGANLNRKVGARALIVFAGILAFGAAHALSSDRDKDLEVRASYNKMVTTKPSFALFKDNVRLEQGSLKASGDEARVYEGDPSDESGRRIVLTGSPARLEQLQDNNGGLMTARAAQIDYNDGTHIAILTGDVVVVQAGKSEFRGQRMTYNTETGAMEGGSQAPGSEVHMTFKPKPRKPATDANP
ncbi:MAG TPA: lipopolysaccharide transport periplasmic protein LptA [Dokdonella sp.]|uniref:lipopolysaccharide transport periplasmic protein LptA n=1 Tax=Dokdonella sp. TaxID=2291710 RepID=UPI002D7F8CC8|nr:lipopolysaccharide transport periplasmic protein LptA [Dokdonella sp.]HET9033345.1 lipopolysaccharide transport periplasmic protein LptA [Dokdonella sp.]